jgi:acetate kinase
VAVLTDGRPARRVLVLNAGSSSLKASAIERGETLFRTSMSWGADATRTADRSSGLAAVVETMEREGLGIGSFDAVGHRIVHGGQVFTAPIVIEDAALDSLDALGELAPLHNAIAIETIRAVREALPGVPNVGCFDTAYHATLPASSARYAVPESWYTDWGIRRFGFHGLSVEWAVERAAELLGREPNAVGLVVAHLGSGCSVTAVDDGRSVWTSMGFTPLEGLMMGTRAGSIDPGILVHLLRARRLELDELADTLEHQSGVLGVSGRSADIREIQQLADAGDERARLAVEMFVLRAAAGIAAAAVGLRLLDAVAFTGGIGEHAGRVRAAIVERLAVVGLRPIATDENGEDRVLAAVDTDPTFTGAAPEGASPSSAVLRPRVLRIEAREDVVIARAVADLIGAA